jgi:hypothetical protein
MQFGYFAGVRVFDDIYTLDEIAITADLGRTNRTWAAGLLESSCSMPKVPASGTMRVPAAGSSGLLTASFLQPYLGMVTDAPRRGRITALLGGVFRSSRDNAQ